MGPQASDFQKDLMECLKSLIIPMTSLWVRLGKST